MKEIEFKALYKSLKFDGKVWIHSSVDHRPEVGELLRCSDWMQFTGIIDNNSSRIYSKDIVIDHIGMGVVEYVDDRAAFRVNYQNGHAKWFIDYLDSEKDTLTVIGNICEDSELLEAK